MIRDLLLLVAIWVDRHPIATWAEADLHREDFKGEDLDLGPLSIKEEVRHLDP
jgi:hypothetical protein